MTASRRDQRFDVVVVGAGHAGCEAALAAARMGCATAVVTLDRKAVSRMSCNPAIGGLAKGHLVREIDALGGEMGRVIDATGIQFRLLNTSRGPAVRAPRAQADKDAYAARMADAVNSTANLTLIEGEVVDLIVEGAVLRAAVLADGSLLETTCAVVTSGTFLGGRIHIGGSSRPGGRIHEKPSLGLSKALSALNLPMGRLKTGTPPRITRDSVRFDRMEPQPGDRDPVPFSFETETIDRPQIDCHITHTNRRVHDVIRDNLSRSSMYSGAIRSVGPRYCPSIEDKIVRFADRDRHQIFVEPEGVEHPWIYLNGLSTSLPEEVQRSMVRLIPGLEEAEVARPGYAVEYDFVQPTACAHTLETRSTRGLFLAGQINGTTGYEEAAALGLMAGINAALSVQRRESLILSRSEAYIGVLIDDLVLKGTVEPYRMFTSRAEYRLLLDIDSADLRLTRQGHRIGLIPAARYERFLQRERRVNAYRKVLEETDITPRAEVVERGRELLGITLSGATTPAMLLRRGDVSIASIDRFLGGAVPEGVTVRERRYLADRLRYGGYIERQERERARLQREEERRIPADFDFTAIPGLSREVIEKLSAIRPESIARAGRISGITPAALTLLVIYLERERRRRSTSGTPAERRCRRTDSRCNEAPASP
jgi:tRNA uridine 5-carboxymethylaminomethyl modification enzyme